MPATTVLMTAANAAEIHARFSLVCIASSVNGVRRQPSTVSGGRWNFRSGCRVADNCGRPQAGVISRIRTRAVCSFLNIATILRRTAAAHARDRRTNAGRTAVAEVSAPGVTLHSLEIEIRFIRSVLRALRVASRLL